MNDDRTNIIPAVKPVIAVGIGNEYRRDDGVGLYVVRRLAGLELNNLEIVEADDNALELLNLWNDTDEIILIDAACSGKEPGTVYNFNAIEQTIPQDIFPCLSTHSFGLAEIIEMAKVFDNMPRSLQVYGIEIADYSLGEGLSPEVQKAADELVEKLLTGFNK